MYGEVRSIDLLAPSTIPLRQDPSQAWSLTVKNDLVDPWVFRDPSVAVSHPVALGKSADFALLCRFFFFFSFGFWGSDSSFNSYRQTLWWLNHPSPHPNSVDCIKFIKFKHEIFKCILLYLWKKFGFLSLLVKSLHRKIWSQLSQCVLVISGLGGPKSLSSQSA